MKRKLLQNAAREQKNFARLEKIFSHINFSLSQKQRYEQKPLSFRSALRFCSAPQPLQIFSRVSFPASKITPIKLIKKGLLQYSSSSRKKTAPQYNSNSLNCKKKPRSPQYSFAQLTASQL